MSTAMLLVTVAGVWAVLIWAGIAWVHYLADDRGPLDKNGLVGIRGWLTLLVGGLIGWGPIISVGRFFLEFSKAESLYPAIKRLPEWQTYTSVMWFLVLVVTAWQIHVGWRMCRERDPSVVAYLKKYLWLSPLTILLLGMPNVLVLKAEYPAAEMLPGAIGFAIVNGIWLWYLSKSKRVARTYNLESADNTITSSPQATDVTAGYTRGSPVAEGRRDGDVAASSHGEAKAQALAGTSRPITSVEEKISQHRLERTLGNALDEELYAKCLADCDFDHLRATALYQRLKAGLDKA